MLDCDSMLTNILRCVEGIVTDERISSDVRLEENIKLLACCEAAMRYPQFPEAAAGAVRKLRVEVAQFWRGHWVTSYKCVHQSESVDHD